MRYYPWFPRAIPHQRAGYPRVTQPFAARNASLTGEAPSLDLHGSGTPPAFTLSQDQTLRPAKSTALSVEGRGQVLRCQPGPEAGPSRSPLVKVPAPPIPERPGPGWQGSLVDQHQPLDPGMGRAGSSAWVTPSKIPRPPAVEPPAAGSWPPVRCRPAPPQVGIAGGRRASQAGGTCRLDPPGARLLW